MKMPKIPKPPALGKAKVLIKANKTALIGIAIGFSVAVPATLYAVERQNNNEQAKQYTQQSDYNIETDQEPADSNALEQQTNPPQDSNTPDSPTSSPNTNTQNSSNTTTGTTATQAPTQTTTSTPTPPKEPDPQYLTTCWIESPTPRQYCPYNPPSSWSGDYLKYPCQKAGYGTVPCPSYKDVRIIEGNNNGQCYFYFYTDKVQRLVFTSPENSPANCLTATPK